MGEAKRRAILRDNFSRHTKPITRSRFNLYAIGTRLSFAAYLSDELSWWSSFDEQLIATVMRDTTDNDFGWIALARDSLGRFRCVDLKMSIRTRKLAEDSLRSTMADIIQHQDISALGNQGDESNVPTDLLRLPTDFDPKTIHPYFRQLLESPARAPARAVIREIGPWLTPADPHLVQEFQTKGFDQRLWEIYLWAAFREFSLDVEQLTAPDFRCRGPGIDFTVEATTVAPSTMGPLAEHPNPKTREETAEFLDNYMPIKYGSSLLSKLNKTNKDGAHYWEIQDAKNKPFVLAIADFHKPATTNELGSMTYTQAALWQYLYGRRVNWEFTDEKLIVRSEPIERHKFGEKEIQTGFFDLPLAENVSAVIFSNAGTLAKFDRMGVVAGFGADKVHYLRIGLKYNPDPNAIIGEPFSHDVSAADYKEFWTDEIQVFHNPNAKLQLPFEYLLGATHHFFKDGQLQSMTPSDAVLSSYTFIVQERNRSE